MPIPQLVYDMPMLVEKQTLHKHPVSDTILLESKHGVVFLEGIVERVNSKEHLFKIQIRRRYM